MKRGFRKEGSVEEQNATGEGSFKYVKDSVIFLEVKASMLCCRPSLLSSTHSEIPVEIGFMEESPVSRKGPTSSCFLCPNCKVLRAFIVKLKRNLCSRLFVLLCLCVANNCMQIV